VRVFNEVSVRSIVWRVKECNKGRRKLSFLNREMKVCCKPKSRTECIDFFPSAFITIILFDINTPTYLSTVCGFGAYKS